MGLHNEPRGRYQLLNLVLREMGMLGGIGIGVCTNV